jgi:hypothetical protein
VGEHREGDVAVPGVVAADLVLVEPDLVLRGLEALLDGASGAGDPDERLVAGAGRAAAAARLGDPEVIMGAALG